MWCTKTKRRYKSLLVVQCTTNPNRQLFHRLFTFIHSTDTLHTLTKWKCAWFWMPLFIFLFQWFSNKQTRMRLLFTTQTHKGSIQTYNGFVFDMSSFCGKNNKTAHKMPHKHTNRWLFKNANKVHSRKNILSVECGSKEQNVNDSVVTWILCPFRSTKSSCYCPHTVIEQSHVCFAKCKQFTRFGPVQITFASLRKYGSTFVPNTKRSTALSVQCTVQTVQMAFTHFWNVFADNSDVTTILQSNVFFDCFFFLL